MQDSARKHDPEVDLINDIAAFHHDPLGYVLYAFPWGVVSAALPGVKPGKTKEYDHFPEPCRHRFSRKALQVHFACPGHLEIIRSFPIMHCMPSGAQSGGQMEQGSVRRRSRLSFIIRAFSYRNYVLFFSGQGISIIGTWMQQIAMTWLVYRMTGSTFLLGVISFTGMIPIFFLSSLAGVFADRHNRYRIVVVTNFLAMGQAFVAAFLTLTGIITVWHIVGLSSFLGMVNAFEIPARQALVIEIVENKEDLGNAIALNSFMFNGGRLIGPSIAGILISLFGEGTCFLINGFSFCHHPVPGP